MPAQTVADLLLNDKVLTVEQYEALKIDAVNTNRPLADLILEHHLATETQIAQAKAQLLGIPFITLENRPSNPAALSLIPEAVARRLSILPIDYNKETNTLTIAMADPTELNSIEFVKQKSGANLTIFAAAPSDILSALTQNYAQDIIFQVKEAVEEKTKETPEEKTLTEGQITQIIKEAPIARIVSTILEYAMKSRASDVHIEPIEGRTRVRYRIDGILHEKLSLPTGIQDALVSRIKILSGMKIDEHRAPQDGRFNFKAGRDEVDLRISVLPTVLGEKIVMRLLWKTGGIPTLPDLGLTGTALRSLETSILRPHGIIIICGPTGSGKTTTLYSILSKLNTTKVNIVTIEDPVEYRIPGINQTQVNPLVGFTFATGLRAFVRQDPNIVLVGEIRDRETTDLAIQAALTGHLIFSTLHTSNAAGSLPRLIDLGAETFLLASTITAIVGQRIVRKICSVCREEYEAPAAITQEVKTVLGKLYPKKTGEKLIIFRGKGCPECNSSGYLGRIGIFEVLPLSGKIAHMILEKQDAGTIEKQAIEEGMITMKQDGYLKVINGQTTVEEVLRVAQE